MSSRAGSLAAILAVAVGLWAAAAVLHAGDWHDASPPPAERLLYLRSGRVADRLMLVFDAVAADVYWIRTIQHYGRDLKSRQPTGRFELLEPLLDLTTSLDPRFTIAYRFGSIFLALPAPNGPGRPDQAIALLQKGLAHDPTRWQYALDIGFMHYWFTGDFGAAARWFTQAASMSGAPIWIQPLAASTRAQGGDRQGARELLRNLGRSDQEWVRQAADRGLAQITALDRIDAAQAVVDRFRTERHSDPTGWLDLVRAGLMPGVPIDPAKIPLEYDPATHRVSLSPASPLGPLPSLPSRR